MFDPLTDRAQRSAIVASLGILGTPRDPAFDRLVFIAAQLFRTPMAALSVLDGNRVWYKARVGLNDAGWDRGVAFCGVALCQDTPLLVEDAGMDPRFHESPLVIGPPGIRFYAGAPIPAPEGLCAQMGLPPMAVGVLCVMDRRRRLVTAAQMAHLVQLAGEASALLAAMTTGRSPGH